ncbi:hypothetical protein EON66_08470 [archaeon]|nr:MAG: hypothetical protein EON66_08470 [archaeon]
MCADVYPIIVAVSAGVSFGIYKGIEHLRAPDVQISPSRRSAATWEDKYDEESADQWRKRVMSNYRHKDDELNKLSITEPLNASWWSKRSEVRSNPTAATRAGTTTVV